VAKQPATPAPISDTRRERLLAFMVIGMVGLSVLAIFAIIIGTAMGAGFDNGFSHPDDDCADGDDNAPPHPRSADSRSPDPTSRKIKRPPRRWRFA
jgi:hypothetical protein